MVVFIVRPIVFYDMLIIAILQDTYLRIYSFTYFLIEAISIPDVAGSILIA
jgi:hypothetical protein